MSTFFNSTTVAAKALYGDFKLKPYYNPYFHLDALITLVAHVARALYNLALLALRLLCAPLYLLNPLAWVGLPQHAMSMVDSAIALAVSLITVAIHPFVAVLRSLSSLVWGYEQNSDFDNGVTPEEEDFWLAVRIL